MLNLKRYSATFIAVIFLFVISSCSNSYTKTITDASAYPNAIEKAKKKHKYMIMQSGLNLYSITSVDLDRAKQQMTVTLDKVDSSRLNNGTSVISKSDTNIKGGNNSASNIYLQLNDSTSYTLDEPHTIPLTKIGKVDLYRK